MIQTISPTTYETAKLSEDNAEEGWCEMKRLREG